MTETEEKETVERTEQESRSDSLLSRLSGSLKSLSPWLPLIGLIGTLVAVFFLGEFLGRNRAEMKITRLEMENDELRDRLKWFQRHFYQLERRTEPTVVRDLQPVEGYPERPDEIEILGRVTDENDEPVSRAQVSIEWGSMVYSDPNGQFTIRCRIGKTLRVMKEGYQHERIKVTRETRKLTVILKRAKAGSNP